MRFSTVFFFIPLVLLGSSPVLRAQSETAVPFLLITPSVDGNGMGGISASLPSDNATATIANPGQLGMFSLNNLLNAAIYTPKVEWLPQYNIPNLTYNTTAVNAALNLRTVLPLPLPLSIGVGYSRIYLDLGKFAVTSSSGPAVIGFFGANEKSESFSVAMGVDFYVKFGLGFNFKSIESNLSPIGTEQETGVGSAKVSARDFGMMLQVPIMEMIATINGEPITIFPKTEPLVDLSLGYVKANVGNELKYVDEAQADPLPRQVVVGMGLELGFVSHAVSGGWKIASFTWARQAEDILVTRTPDGSFTYQSGLGDIDIVDNVLLGKWNGKVTERKGWQVQVAEFLYLRGGSVTMQELQYSTSGYSVSLGGLLKLLEFTASSEPTGGWLRFIADHIDFQFHSSSYEETGSPIGGTSMKQLNLVIRGIPF